MKDACCRNGLFLKQCIFARFHRGTNYLTKCKLIMNKFAVRAEELLVFDHKGSKEVVTSMLNPD
jgi:hypothetical protein